MIGDLFFKVLHIHENRGMQRFVVSYWAGYIIYGLMLFIFGFFAPLSDMLVYSLLCLGAFGLFWRKIHHKHKNKWHIHKGHATSVLFIVSVLLTFPSTMVPPVEGSSLGHFFAVSKYIAETQAISVVPFEMAHTTPLLSQLINSIAYRMGGESLLLLQNWFLSVMAGLALFTLARRRLQVTQAWLLTALIFTIPMVSATSGLGAIQPKLLGMTSLLVWAILIYARSEHPRWLIVASLFTSGALAIDYSGIFLAIAAWIAIFLSAKDFPWRYSLSHNALFILTTIVLSAAWYLWNYLHLGNPVFPFSPTTTTALEQFSLYKEAVIDPYAALDNRNLQTLFTYPYDLLVNREENTSQYGGLGPLFFMLFVPAILHFLRQFPFWDWSLQIDTSTLVISIFVVYYSMWFFYSPSLDPKALLAVLPLLALPVWELAAKTYAKSTYFVRFGLMSSMFVILSLQMGVSTHLNQQTISVLFHKQDVDTYVAEHDAAAFIAPYLTERLSDEEKVMHTDTPSLNYHLGSKGVHASSIFAKDIPITTGDSVQLLNVLMRQGISYWVTQNNPEDPLYDSVTNAHKTLRQLISYGCFETMNAQNDIYIYQFIPYCSGSSAHVTLVSSH